MVRFEFTQQQHGCLFTLPQSDDYDEALALISWIDGKQSQDATKQSTMHRYPLEFEFELKLGFELVFGVPNYGRTV